VEDQDLGDRVQEETGDKEPLHQVLWGDMTIIRVDLLGSGDLVVQG